MDRVAKPIIKIGNRAVYLRINNPIFPAGKYYAKARVKDAARFAIEVNNCI
jgi:hypothetical protein